MLSKSEDNRAYLVDRRDSTIRRSRNKMPGKMREAYSFGGDPETGELAYWLLVEAEYATVLFIPVNEVEDCTYPYIYGFARKEFDKLDLPEVEWTQLFVNRIYSGLYLKVELPEDPTGSEGRKGPRREILSVDGNRLALVDTLFNPDARLLSDILLAGDFPEFEEPPPAINWLESKNSSAEKSFVLNNQPPYGVSLLPLPVTIDEIYFKLKDEKLRRYVDDRFADWVRQIENEPPPPGDKLLGEDLWETYLEGYEQYRKDFNAALSSHRELFGKTGTGDIELRSSLE